MRVAFCDDDSFFLDASKALFERYCLKTGGVFAEFFESGILLEKAHLASPFDAVFLDAIMPEQNGLETAKKIREYDSDVKIVFLTSSSDYAVDSYGVKASNYLLKPVDEEKLFACLDEFLESAQKSTKSILVKSGNINHLIPIDEIEYVEAQNKHILFALSGGRSVSSLEPMYSLEESLSSADGFFKCSRSYIVNINMISAFSPKEVTMRSGCRIPVSRRIQKDFEKLYFSTLFGKAGEK